MSKLNIALVSFEYPLYTGYGGIASYIRDTAEMFTANGHSVTVFCAGTIEEVRQPTPLLRECVVDTLDKDEFAFLLLPAFRREHTCKPFDLIEAAEINADARCVKEEFPSLPLVIKLHTPSFLLQRLNYMPIKLTTKLRFFLGSLRRGKLCWLKPDLRILALRDEREAWIYRHADLVISPSRSLIQIVEERWGKRADGIRWLPNPYVLPALHSVEHASSGSISGAFIGRLEKRKGFLVLVEALRLLECSGQGIPFVFIGHPHPYPGKSMTMQDWALRRLKQHHLYRFTGHLPRDQVAENLANIDFVVLPSLWENFPYTCLEAMGQEKVVLGSSQGGMADMIENGVDGLLLNNPSSHRELADRLLYVAKNCRDLRPLAVKARKKVFTLFTPDAILASHLEVYRLAIAYAQDGGRAL